MSKQPAAPERPDGTAERPAGGRAARRGVAVGAHRADPAGPARRRPRGVRRAGVRQDQHRRPGRAGRVQRGQPLPPLRRQERAVPRAVAGAPAGPGGGGQPGGGAGPAGRRDRHHRAVLRGRAGLPRGQLAAARPGPAVLLRGRSARLRGAQAPPRQRVGGPERRSARLAGHRAGPAARGGADLPDRRGRTRGGHGQEPPPGLPIIEAVIEYARRLLAGGHYRPPAGDATAAG